MRLSVAIGTMVIVGALAALHAGVSGLGRPSIAFASSGAVVAGQGYSAWNGDQTSVSISAQNIVTTTTCHTDPNDPNSPTGPCGLGAFGFDVSWDPGAVSYSSISAGAFLASTGRGTSCFAPTVGASSVHFQCVSLGGSPLGPQGSGVLAVLTLHVLSGSNGSSTPLTVSNVNLTDITGAQFPGTPIDGAINFGPCIDVSAPPDGLVDLSDAVIILQHFGEAPPSQPEYDPNGDGGVDLSDAVLALLEFGQSCVAP